MSTTSAPTRPKRWTTRISRIRWPKRSEKGRIRARHRPLRFGRGNGHHAQQASAHPRRSGVAQGDRRTCQKTQQRQRHRSAGTLHHQRRSGGVHRDLPHYRVRGRPSRTPHRQRFPSRAANRSARPASSLLHYGTRCETDAAARPLQPLPVEKYPVERRGYSFAPARDRRTIRKEPSRCPTSRHKRRPPSTNSL